MSGLTLYDRALLSASFYYHWDDRLNCERSISKLKERKYPEAAIETVRLRFGCKTHSDSPRATIDGVGFHSCLCNFQHPLFFAYLDLADKLNKGLLPDRGSYLDQPAHTIEALNLIERLRGEAQRAEQIKEAKPNGRK